MSRHIQLHERQQRQTAFPWCGGNSRLRNLELGTVVSARRKNATSFDRHDKIQRAVQTDFVLGNSFGRMESRLEEIAGKRSPASRTVAQFHQAFFETASALFRKALVFPRTSPEEARNAVSKDEK